MQSVSMLRSLVVLSSQSCLELSGHIQPERTLGTAALAILSPFKLLQPTMPDANTNKLNGNQPYVDLSVSYPASAKCA
jgi:hypothetical protein